MKVLIANRGEIAVRVARTLRRLGHRSVAVFAEDESDALHRTSADEAVSLIGNGSRAYMDQDQITQAAASAGVDAVHPGYGFLSENADFAQHCRDNGLIFVGPLPTVLRCLGDKVAARAAAVAAGVPVLEATEAGADEAAVHEFFRSHSRGIMIKAVDGGGGRGMRVVRDPGEVAEAHHRCVEESRIGFGGGSVFAEELLDKAQHIEVQVVSAPHRSGSIALAIGDRDCTVQRQRQKILEIGPAPWLPRSVRQRMHADATRLCASIGYRGIATVEFLYDRENDRYVFLEVNPRIQVEHTVTEEATGVDLVEIQMRIAEGAQFDDLGLTTGIRSDGENARGECAEPAKLSVQCRINTETLRTDGSVTGSVGVLDVFEPPQGIGVRVDTHGYVGMSANLHYDSLLAKLIVTLDKHDVEMLFDRAAKELGAFGIHGIETNVGLLTALLADPALRAGEMDTTYVERHLPSLVRAPADRTDGRGSEVPVEDSTTTAPMAGTVVEVAAVDDEYGRGAAVAVIEAMKMHHTVRLPRSGRITEAFVSVGDTVGVGQPLLVFEPTSSTDAEEADKGLSLDAIRPDLKELLHRRSLVQDTARPEAVAKRRARGRRTTRENVSDFLDPDSLIEYGPLAIAAQRGRRTEEDLIRNTPADGLVAGVGTTGADVFGDEASRVAVIAYDFTVLAGTQGRRNHAKIDRVFELVQRRRMPLVVWAEGGGGRPADVDGGSLTGRLDGPSFHNLGRLVGKVPIVSIVSGRCFAGNAAMAGMSDVIIATPDANIGMSGPAMIEGGGLGTFSPDDIGPIDVQLANGVVDILAGDDADAVAKAKQYLSYIQGDVTEWEAPDSRLARHVVPADRLRSYEARSAVDSIVDVGSVLELRQQYGKGIMTAFVRIEGRPFGLVVNNTLHLGGAIDAEAADKLWEFLALCNQYGLPLISLCDTPGFMVGPDAEAEGGVKKFSRLFARGAGLRVPIGVVILRKGYGLGAMAMAGGAFKVPDLTVSWPTGEIGGMGLEGAVQLGYKKELETVEDPAERKELYDRLIAQAYRDGRSMTSATNFEIDDVIDPAETRAWLLTLEHPSP